MDKRNKKDKKYKIIAIPKPSSFYFGYNLDDDKSFVWNRYSTKKGAEEALKSLINKYSKFYEFELNQKH